MSECDSENFDSPAPVAYVTFRNPATSDVLNNVPMLIDTGADATPVPTESVKKLGIIAEEKEHSRFKVSAAMQTF